MTPSCSVASRWSAALRLPPEQSCSGHIESTAAPIRLKDETATGGPLALESDGGQIPQRLLTLCDGARDVGSGQTGEFSIAPGQRLIDHSGQEVADRGLIAREVHLAQRIQKRLAPQPPKYTLVPVWRSFRMKPCK
jgi:hypothetical protein